MKVVCAGVGVGGAMSAGGPRRAAASTCLVHTYSLSRSLNELRDGWWNACYSTPYLLTHRALHYYVDIILQLVLLVLCDSHTLAEILCLGCDSYLQ